jgi:hypothetical protein
MENDRPMSVREAAVAGAFYAEGEAALRRQLKGLMPAAERQRALAAVVPHAGYMFSGKVAGAVYASLEVPRDVVILCFSHRGAGADVAVWPEGAWRTPLGDAPVNGDLAQAVRRAFPEARFDEEAHEGEHSGEVQVPFLQAARPDVRIVPVALSGSPSERSARRLEEFGRALAGVPGDFLVVASTDMNHFEDQETTVEKDLAAIAAIERLDGEKLRETLVSKDVSMCGYAPVIAAMAYAKARGASAARLVMHLTSGDVTGDFERVVGYCGMIMPCGSSSARTPAGN